MFVERVPDDGVALAAAIRELGFGLTDAQAADIVRGKDFVQLKNGPFDLDLVFAPDGIEQFSDAWARRVEVEGFSVCHPDDIIASKAATNRVKDRKSLPRRRFSSRFARIVQCNSATPFHPVAHGRLG